MWSEILHFEGVRLGINYGLNKVRFPSPVPVGSRIRTGATLVSVETVADGSVQIVVDFVIEREGGEKAVLHRPGAVPLLHLTRTDAGRGVSAWNAGRENPLPSTRSRRAHARVCSRRPTSLARRSTRRIFPEIVLGSSANSSLRMRL